MRYTEVATIVERCYEHLQQLKADGTHDRLLEMDKLTEQVMGHPVLWQFQSLFLPQPVQGPVDPGVQERPQLQAV